MPKEYQKRYLPESSSSSRSMTSVPNRPTYDYQQMNIPLTPRLLLPAPFQNHQLFPSSAVRSQTPYALSTHQSPYFFAINQPSPSSTLPINLWRSEMDLDPRSQARQPNQLPPCCYYTKSNCSSSQCPDFNSSLARLPCSRSQRVFPALGSSPYMTPSPSPQSPWVPSRCSPSPGLELASTISHLPSNHLAPCQQQQNVIPSPEPTVTLCYRPQRTHLAPYSPAMLSQSSSSPSIPTSDLDSPRSSVSEQSALPSLPDLKDLPEVIEIPELSYLPQLPAQPEPLKLSDGARRLPEQKQLPELSDDVSEVPLLIKLPDLPDEVLQLPEQPSVPDLANVPESLKVPEISELPDLSTYFLPETLDDILMSLQTNSVSKECLPNNVTPKRYSEENRKSENVQPDNKSIDENQSQVNEELLICKEWLYFLSVLNSRSAAMFGEDEPGSPQSNNEVSFCSAMHLIKLNKIFKKCKTSLDLQTFTRLFILFPEVDFNVFIDPSIGKSILQLIRHVAASEMERATKELGHLQSTLQAQRARADKLLLNYLIVPCYLLLTIGPPAASTLKFVTECCHIVTQQASRRIPDKSFVRMFAACKFVQCRVTFQWCGGRASECYSLCNRLIERITKANVCGERELKRVKLIVYDMLLQCCRFWGVPTVPNYCAQIVFHLQSDLGISGKLTLEALCDGQSIF